MRQKRRTNQRPEYNSISYHHEEPTVTEPTDDFAAMFEASFQAKRFEKGQTL
jgi:hypothetical protein